MPVTQVKTSKFSSPKRSKETGPFPTRMGALAGKIGVPGAVVAAPALAEPDWRSDVGHVTGWTFVRNNPEATFLLRVNKDGPPPGADTLAAGKDPCWLWTGAPNGTGYGRILVSGRRMMAHRFSYETYVGPIPQGLDLDHLCRVTLCVNPAHLEPVTNVENTMRGMGKGAVYARRDHCKNGHPFPANGPLRSDAGRRCLTCEQERSRRRHAGRPTNGERTHCRKGHEYTPENTYITTQGSRSCRTCNRDRLRRYRQAS